MDDDIDLYAGSDVDSGREEENPPLDDENHASDTKDEPQVVPPKRKKVVKNPQPKLDENRLLAAKGVTALQEYFKDVELKGKGHEKEDLDLIMGKLQLWTHRLFPKMKFDDALEKIEALGHKKTVQAHVKKIRLGLITQSDLEGFVDEEDFDEALRNASGPLDEHPGSNVDTNAIFDDLLTTQNRPVSSANVSTPAPPKATQMTDELRKKIEENRRKAQERLQAKRAAEVGTSINSETAAADDVEPPVARVEDPKTNVTMTPADSHQSNVSISEEVVSVNADMEFVNAKGSEGTENIVCDLEEKKESQLPVERALRDSDDESDVEMPVMKKQRRAIVGSDSD